MANYQHQLQFNQESLVKNYSVPDQFMGRCRICLKFGDIPIYGNVEHPDVSDDVMAFGDIKLSIDDDLPHNLCSVCNKLLHGAKQFRIRAKKSDDILQNNKNKFTYNTCIKSLNFENSLSETHEINCTPINRENKHSQFKHYFDKDFSNMQEDNINEFLSQKKNETIMIIVSNNESATAGDYNRSEIYSCEVCNMDFESSDDYSQHIRTISHINTEKRSQKVKCEFCNKVLSKMYLSSHLVYHHLDTKINNACGINFQYNNDVESHQEMYDRNMGKGTTKMEYQYIEKISDKNYSEHQGEPMRTEKQLSKLSHSKLKQDNQKSNNYYVCEICGKVIRRQNSFKLHILTHGSELNYKCMFCPYRGLHPGLLKIHVRTHTGDYNYKCTICSARFINKSNLSKHIQRHMGPINFKCNTCHRGFYSKLELERHFKVNHLGIKNCICNICGKAFGSRHLMMNHQLKIHKREKLTTGRGRLPNYLRAQIVQ